MVFPRAVKAVVFDMDGLLFDTEALFFEAMRTAGAERGHEIPRPFFLGLVGLTAERNFARMREHFGPDFPAEQFHARCHDHFRDIEHGIALKVGAIELLDRLDRLRLPRAIATSSARLNVERNLGRFGMSHRFDAIVAAGDYLQGKPHPAPYLTAAAALGVAPTDCLALEDSHNGVKSAAAAGMMTIMVPDLLEPTDEIAALVIHVAQNLHEVRGLLDVEAAGRGDGLVGRR